MSNSCNPSFIEIELIPAARDPGIGIIPWCPLAGGMLSGNDKKGERRGPVEKLEAYAKLCAELGRTEADVAIAWLLRNPGDERGDWAEQRCPFGADGTCGGASAPRRLLLKAG